MYARCRRSPTRRVINQIKIENPHPWSPDFQEEVRAILRDAAEMEAAYGRDPMPRGFLGLNAGPGG